MNAIFTFWNVLWSKNNNKLTTYITALYFTYKHPCYTLWKLNALCPFCLAKYNTLNFTIECPHSSRDGTIWWYIGVSQYIVFQYMYRYSKMSINTSIYRCITVYWSMNCFLPWIKLWNWHFIENGCEINLVQYGDSHGFIAIWENYLIAFSKLVIIYARASNTFKQ